MNKRERVLNAFNNKPVDRVPMGFWFHFLPGDKLYTGLDEPEIMVKNIEGHQKYHDAFDMDFVKVMTDGLFYRPLDTYPEIKEAADYYKVQPLPADHPFFTESQKHAKAIRKMFGPDIMIFYNICSPLNCLTKVAFGSSVLKKQPEILTEDPEAFRHACNAIGEDMVRLTKLIMSDGTVDGIYMSAHDDNFIPVDLYAKYCAESEIMVLEAANAINDNNIIHICGYRGRRNKLEIFKNYPVKVFNWATHSERLSLKDGKKFFGGKAVIGGFDQMPDSLIVTGSKKEIQDYVKELIAENGTTGVIVGADCTIPDTTPIEHLEWVKEALIEIGA